MAIDALLPGTATPRCVFNTKFSGVTLGTPTRNGTGRDWDTSIDGTDSITGYTFTDTRLTDFMGPTAYFRLQQINGTDQPIPTHISGSPSGAAYDFVTYFNNTIATSTNLSGVPGAGHLSLRNILVNSTSYPVQSALMMSRSSPSMMSHNFDEFYYAATHKFPTGMALNAAGKSKVIFEVKGGGLDQTLVNNVITGVTRDGSNCGSSSGLAGAGFFRMLILIQGAFGNNVIQVKIDDNANNDGLTLPGSVPIPHAYWDATGFHEGGASVLSHVNIGTAAILPGGVPLNVPVRFHVHYKRPPTPLYADRVRGIFKVAMENLATNAWYSLVDIHDSYDYQLSSTFNEPIGRFFPTSYDTQSDIELQFTDFQIWDKPTITF